MRSLLICVSSLLLSSLFADIVPTPGTQPVAPVFAQADLVCNCVVESVRVLSEQKLGPSGKTVTHRQAVASVRVKQAYNKDVSPGTLVYVAFDDEIPIMHASLPSLTESETALMFLSLSTPSTYRFSDPFLGVTPFTSIPVQHGNPGLLELQAALTGVLQHGDSGDTVNALQLLQGFDQFPPETLAALDSLRDSSDPEIALASIAVLLKAKQPGNVQELANYLRAHHMSTEPMAVASIGSELSKVTNVGDLAALGTLTSSDSLSIKLGAMAALRNIRSVQSAPALVKRLDDPNKDIQYLAVIALAEIFQKNNEYAPNMALFDQNPGHYTEIWKTWWKREGQNFSNQGR